MKIINKTFLMFLILTLANVTNITAEEVKKKEKTPFEIVRDKLLNLEEKKKIKIEDVNDLGKPMIIEDFPEGMIKAFGKSCTKFICRTKKAARIMSLTFSRGEDYNARHPDNMIKGMAYFEVFYMGQLRKNKKHVENYKKYYDKKKEEIPNLTRLNFYKTENIIRSLIGTNKGRKSMREALGMTIDIDPAIAIKRFWYLGEMLALGESKKTKINKEMKDRAEIMKRYSAVINKMKNKLEEEEEKRKDSEPKDKKNKGNR